MGADKAHNKFYDQVYAAVERHFDLDTLKVLIIASPGFVKEAVYQHIIDEAVVSGSQSWGYRNRMLTAITPVETRQQVYPLGQVKVPAPPFPLPPRPLPRPDPLQSRNLQPA